MQNKKMELRWRSLPLVSLGASFESSCWLWLPTLGTRWPQSRCNHSHSRIILVEAAKVAVLLIPKTAV